MTERERMDAGLIYDSGVDEIMGEQAIYLEMLYDFNATRPSEMGKREELLKKMFGSIGEGCYIEPPLRANWGAKHVYMGEYSYANFNLTLVDDGNIYIGDHVMIAPNVTITTAGHPILAQLREKNLQFNKDVHIGNNVWLGAGVLVMPGVTIGDNTTIGAGSVVTHDIPSDVVAFGSPCRVIREVNERDREFFYKDEKIDWENIRDRYGV